MLYIQICCLSAAEVGGIFSADAPFVKSILLHVFTSLAIYLALYITTKYCSNKAVYPSYISPFYCTDASFTNPFIISGKHFHQS